MSKDEFLKNDQEKNRLELLDFKFVEGIGRILTFGAIKYKAWNWQKAGSDEDLERIKGAMMRHSFAYMNGDKLDPETGESHLYHMGCCMMFLDYFDRHKKLEPNIKEGSPTDDELTYGEHERAKERGKEDSSVEAWLKGSLLIMRERDDEDRIVINLQGTRDAWRFRTYAEFFTWLNENWNDLIIKNGPDESKL